MTIESGSKRKFSFNFNNNILFQEPICDNYAPGTYLPVANVYDEFIICGNNGKSIRKKCKSGFSYNALRANCEMSEYKINSFEDFLLL